MSDLWITMSITMMTLTKQAKGQLNNVNGNSVMMYLGHAVMYLQKATSAYGGCYPSGNYLCLCRL